MTSTYAQRKALGDFGERLAAEHLAGLGYVLLDRNWRTRGGELDIVAADGPVLVGCEVKTRSSQRFGSPLDAVDADKAARVQRLVRIWAAQHEFRYAAVRFDVVTVLRARKGPADVRHLVGVC
jgi:putative endonuclease